MCTATHNSHTQILPRPVPSCHLKAVADFNNQAQLRANPLGKHTTYTIIAIAYIYIYILYIITLYSQVCWGSHNIHIYPLNIAGRRSRCLKLHWGEDKGSWNWKLLSQAVATLTQSRTQQMQQPNTPELHHYSRLLFEERVMYSLTGHCAEVIIMLLGVWHTVQSKKKWSHFSVFNVCHSFSFIFSFWCTLC